MEFHNRCLNLQLYYYYWDFFSRTQGYMFIPMYNFLLILKFCLYRLFLPCNSTLHVEMYVRKADPAPGTPSSSSSRAHLSGEAPRTLPDVTYFSHIKNNTHIPY